MTTSARRQLFRRSKAGCWNCRSKKKKCDELRPHCTRCIRAGESCRYPDASSESLNEGNPSISGSDYASPSMSSSASFPNSLSSMHATPMLSRSSSTSGYPSQHLSRHGQHNSYHHHPYASTSSPNAPPPQHRDYHSQRPHPLQRPSPPASSASHHPYYPASHGNAPTQVPQQHFPPPLSASAAADWDHTSQQHVYKRTRYDDFSSSSSSTSSNPAYQDARARQPFDAHHRIPSNQSQTSSKGKSRDTLPPISPHQPHSVPMAASASLPPFNAVSPPPQQRPMASPNLASRSAETSPANHASPVFAHSRQQMPRAAETSGSDPRVAAQQAYPPAPAAHAQSAGLDSHSNAPQSPSSHPSSSASQPRHKLVLDYASTEPDPEELMGDLYSLSFSTVTQPTKGTKAYFRLLQGIARMGQGQAMAHALAAVIATQQANFASRPGSDSTINGNAAEGEPRSPEQPTRSVKYQQGHSSAVSNSTVAPLLELANRHHLAAIKALQTQQQPSRRRRFSVIDSNTSSGFDELPVGSNAAAMMLLILACSSVGKSLMLPSYFNQCEQFLADAVEHISSHRLFPSVTGEPIVGTAEDPPILPPENLSNHGGLLFLGAVVGLYECYLSQYTAITDWDYNPARLRRLLPYNWSESDAAIFDQARGSVAETTYSISMVTIELLIETLDTMRKFKRAEAVAYGNRKSSRSEAEDGTAALDSLALREELGLLIRDLEAGTFWKGTARILTEAEQLQVLDSINGRSRSNGNANAQTPKSEQNMPPPPSTSTDDQPNNAVTKAFQSGNLFLTSSAGEQQVNRLRLANHLYRNALLVDLYVTVFNRPSTSLAVRDLICRSISLLAAVPDKLEQGLMWPAIVLGSYAQDTPERDQVRAFVRRAQWKGTSGPATASDVIKRVWSEEAETWRESVTYFGSPYIS
ncbi:uncharacterized protein UTRI_02178_B [Ustilago trichophora]|uniref:Zn(2)-C6 fungal-type domain-containing protein n=1 Tax=Ustilago trichophora TaxID=86804 RepID=A0A5C3DWY0_9BASI|nr:uncharacterized protein UTRI_02178_B [Ustilago trichophora]